MRALVAGLLLCACAAPPASKATCGGACEADRECARGGDTCRLGRCVPPGFDAHTCPPLSTSTASPLSGSSSGSGSTAGSSTASSSASASSTAGGSSAAGSTSTSSSSASANSGGASSTSSTSSTSSASASTASSSASAGTGTSGSATSSGTSAAGTTTGGTTGSADGGCFVLEDAYTLSTFEDGSYRLARQGNRNGGWYLYTDGTPGSVSPTALVSPDYGGASGSCRAAHWSGSGFRDWGAAAAITLQVDASGDRQLYDLSGYAGISFWARTGAGQVGAQHLYVTIDDIDTFPEGGTCSTGFPDGGSACFRPNGTSIPLTGSWTKFSLPWSSFGAGWRPLAPSQAYGATFKPTSATQPFDLWVDEVRLLP